MLVFVCLQVVDNMDSRLRSMIATAKVYDQKQQDFNYTMPMATIMAIHGYVADGAAATAVGQLSSALAADPTMDISASVTQLSKVWISQSLYLLEIHVMLKALACHLQCMTT
jgi:hypothetical protein